MLKWANILFFQWFFIRLTRCEQKVIDEFQPLSYGVYYPVGMWSMDFSHGGSLEGKIIKSHTERWYSIQGWIWPLTGYRSGFVYTLRNRKPWFKRITQIEIIK